MTTKAAEIKVSPCEVLVLDALDVALKANKKQDVAPQVLLRAVAALAAERFGRLARVVFYENGIFTSLHVGMVVMGLVERRLLKKSETDRLEDFAQPDFLALADEIVTAEIAAL